MSILASFWKLSANIALFLETCKYFSFFFMPAKQRAVYVGMIILDFSFFILAHLFSFDGRFLKERWREK